MALETGFRLHRIIGMGEGETPTLEGTNARLIVTCALSPADVGRVAVCQAATSEPDVLVVFGCLQDDAPATEPDAPLVLQAGKSRLTLHPDGRVRVSGVDVGVDAEAGFSVAAGRIDLN